MTALVGGAGTSLGIGTGYVSTVSNDLPGSRLAFGNGGVYQAAPYQVYLSMWGIYQANNTHMVYTTNLAVNPATFPNNTQIDFNITQDPGYLGINGYLALNYGNYDNSGVALPAGPKQVKNITTCAITVNWAFTGSQISSILSECYLTTTAHSTGGVSTTDPVIEVGFFPHPSAAEISYVQSITSLGSYTDTAGTTWNVAKGTSGVTGAPPYVVATLPGYTDHQGLFDYKSYFTFLISKGIITGNEYFNGVAFGTECLAGASQLTINSFTPAYS